MINPDVYTLGLGDRDREHTEVLLLAQAMGVSDVPMHKLCGQECCTSSNALSSYILSTDELKGEGRA